MSRRWTMGRLVGLAVAGVGLGALPVAEAQPLPTALRTFDPAKWSSSAQVRIEETAAGAALLGAARRGAPDTGNPTTPITFTDEAAVTAVEATVTVLDASRRDTQFSAPALRIDGFFYRDGTGTGTATDQTGHVQGDIRIGVRNDQTLGAFCFVSKCTNAACTTFEDTFSADLGDASFFVPHRLRIAFDFVTGDFTFQVDDRTPVVFTVADATRLTPSFPFMQIRARAGSSDGADPGGSMLALVDDVTMNGAPYDAFGSVELPRASLVPGSGAVVSSLTSDVQVVVETAGEEVTDVKLFLDGTDVSSFLAAAIPGTLPGGGQTFRFPAILLATVVAPGSTAVVGVEATTASGASTSGFAIWEVLP